MNGLFVTGTDTGVGKTAISAALLLGCRARGLRACGMKPVASGSSADAHGRHHNEDALQLRAYGSSATDAPRYRDINPYALPLPLAPHLAARAAGITIDPGLILAAFRRLRAGHDVVVVEGVGGWLVPLSETLTMADLAVTLGLPVVLVVGLRLGCLNHALLTAAAIRACGLPLAGWVANGIDPEMAAREENIAALRQRLDAPLLGSVPYMKKPAIEAVAAHLDSGLLFAAGRSG